MNEINEKEHANKAKELNKDEVLHIINGLPSKSNITFTGGEVFLKKGMQFRYLFELQIYTMQMLQLYFF